MRSVWLAVLLFALTGNASFCREILLEPGLDLEDAFEDAAAGDTFILCDGEAEIISSKSCGNVYRHNVFLKCARVRLV